jgi:ElaB/YqjD/DUF883 family membrane-anchored ribosome-binding protein
MHHSARTAALSREFQNFLADVENLLEDTADVGGAELDSARAKIRDRLVQAKETAVHLGGDLANGASRLANAAIHEAKEEPWKVLGAGAAAGLLLGLLFARR